MEKYMLKFSEQYSYVKDLTTRIYYKGSRVFPYLGVDDLEDVIIMAIKRINNPKTPYDPSKGTYKTWVYQRILSCMDGVNKNNYRQFSRSERALLDENKFAFLCEDLEYNSLFIKDALDKLNLDSEEKKCIESVFIGEVNTFHSYFRASGLGYKKSKTLSKNLITKLSNSLGGDFNVRAW
jgi:hypothetical protein